MAGFGRHVKGVRDQATWNAAKPNLETILEEIPRLTAMLQALPSPSQQEYDLYLQKTATREAALEATLGDKDTFLANLPPEVASELTTLAGRFYNVMGAAQDALRGPPPRRPAPPRSQNP
jgi:hypothetical protein